MRNWRNWPWPLVGKAIGGTATLLLAFLAYVLQRADSPTLNGAKQPPVIAARALPTAFVKNLSTFLRDSLAKQTKVSVDDPAVQNFIGNSSVEQESARRFAEQLIASLRSSIENVRVGRGLAERKDYVAARNAFAQATRDDPDNAFAWANLGAAEAMLGNPNESRAAYMRAVQIAPQNWLAHYNLACLDARSGNRDEAFGHLETAVGQAKRSMPNTASVQSLIAKMRRDDSLINLKSDPRYNAILSAN